MDKILATKKQKAENDPEYKKRQAENAIKNLQKYKAAYANGEIQLTDKQRMARRTNALTTAWNKYFKNKGISLEDYLKEKGIEQSPNNHKVVSVNRCENGVVYDLTVDSYHNFAISVGVFVHNCVAYSDATQRFVFQNSWSSAWGQQGFFTIPYEYITNPRLTADLWSIRVVE